MGCIIAASLGIAAGWFAFHSKLGLAIVVGLVVFNVVWDSIHAGNWGPAIEGLDSRLQELEEKAEDDDIGEYDDIDDF
ncbi:MAG TPA: hypothetical protein VIP11_05165 [Gemmatimonadaceae bacterium]